MELRGRRDPIPVESTGTAEHRSHWLFRASRASVSTVGARARMRRMEQFAHLLDVRAGMRILDLGGRPQIWQSLPGPVDLTILNLPGEHDDAGYPSRHHVTYVAGDATDVRFPDASFDLVFSNSVIEHVGPEEKQRAFARETQRLAPSYWVQTPSKWFPVEAHTGMPGWWFYPEPVRRAFLERWHRVLPAWADSMAGTRVLEREFFHDLFPGSELWVESIASVPKSYAVYRRAPGARACAS
jgi:hypothetical protein